MGASLLRFDASTIQPADHEHADLVRRYSPYLVLFSEPESSEEPRPYRKGEADYHPRPVELFLDTALLATSMRFGVATVFSFVLGFAGLLGGPAAVLSQDDWDLTTIAATMATSIALGLIGASIPVYAALKFSPRGVQAIRSALRRRFTDGLRTSRLIGARSPRKAWETYIQSIQNAPVDRGPTCYVHVVDKPRGSPGLALQYWMFYYANDFWNYHNADWEVVTVFLPSNPQAGDHEPVACAYSCHVNGRLRLWDDVIKGGDSKTHPVVYVARGSHANYFEPTPVGYETRVSRPWRFFGVRMSRVRMFIELSADDPAGRRRDYVPNLSWASTPVSRAGMMQIIPYDIDSEVVPFGEAPNWDQWWWLRYRGSWGPGVSGPPWQGNKWKDPWQWARDFCAPDLTGAWEEVTR